IRATLQHLRRGRPVRPFSLVADTRDASPGETRPPDADAIPERLMIRKHKVKPTLSGADDDGARRFLAVKRDRLAGDRGSDWLQLRIQSIGEHGRRGGA